MAERTTRTCLMLVVVCALAAGHVRAAEERPCPSLVKVVTKDARVIVGVLEEETPEGLRLLDLKTGERVALERAQVVGLARGVSAQAAVRWAGLPEYVAWRVKVLEASEVPSAGGPGVKEPAEAAARPRGVVICPIIDTRRTKTQAARLLRESWAKLLAERGVSRVKCIEIEGHIAEIVEKPEDVLDPEKAVLIGRESEALVVLTGVISAAGRGVPVVRARLIEVSTGEVIVEASEPVPPGMDKACAAAAEEGAVAEEPRPERRPTRPPAPGDIKCVWELRREASRMARLHAVSDRCEALLSARDVDATVRAYAYRGNCYAVLPVQTNWHEARAVCEQLGGHLAIIEDDAENQFVWGTAMGKGNFVAWIGCSDQTNEGHWEWVDGTVASDVPWADGQPNNSQGEDFAVIGCRRTPRWADARPDDMFWPVCEWENVMVGTDKAVPDPPYLFGGASGAVHTVTAGPSQIMVWPVLPEFCGPGRYRVSMQHATTGPHGVFHLIAWADTDGDGVPDTEIGRSPKTSVSEPGQWSSWEFRSHHKAIFVGCCWEQDTLTVYLTSRAPKGWLGLGNTRFFVHEFNGVPTERASPRYTNILVTWMPE